MSTSLYLRQTIFAILILTFTTAFAQTNTEKIKAKWNIDRFEVEKNTPQTIKAKQDLQGVCLTFGNDELVISKKTETGYDVIKRGSYFVSGNSLTIGKDQANILLLSEKNLTIKISGQGVLYLTKM
jgi:hypothetical protein